MLLALMKGFSASGGLIMAIGAQNAFVIRQGLLNRHLFLTALLCSTLDATLIMAGVLGFGKLLATAPILIYLCKAFAIAFLFLYGALSMRSAFKEKSLKDISSDPTFSKKGTILAILALTLLNPHAYLDTVFLLGSIASQHPTDEQMFFALGAISASFAWFFFITYASRILAPVFNNPQSWKIIDALVALMMWGIAVTLLLTAF